MNLYDKIKSPFEDEETIKKIIKNFSDKKPHSSGEFYHHILRNNSELINNNEYMDSFDENIFWPLLENDWKNIGNDISKNSGLKKIYDRFASYQDLYNYINKLEKGTLEALAKHREYSRKKNPDTELVNKYKEILQGKTGNVGELIAAYNLYRDLPQSHTFHSQDLMGFHFNSQVHDRTENREKAEIKFYINAGEDSFKVAKLFLDKCREANVESYYFKVVDPMHKEQERNDRLCIYSSIEHSKTFLDFLTQIKSENPGISFKKPPLTVGVIDDFIGIGTDTLDREASYNQTIGSVIYDVLVEVCKNNGINQGDLFNYIENNPNNLEKIKEMLIERSAEKGCSIEKTCVTDKLAERLKTVEMTDTIEKENEVENNNEKSSSLRKGPVQVYDENGNIIIQDFINPTLLERKIKLSNGYEMSAKQFIQENFAPHIPKSGIFKLKNGNEISARQYIEEFVMFELEKYNGDLDALMQDTLSGTDEPPQKDGWTQPTHGQEMGISEEQAEDLNTKNRIDLASFKKSLKTKRDKEKIGFSEVKESQDEIALRQERGKLISLSMRGQLDEDGKRRLEELNGMLNIRNTQYITDKGQKNGKQTGQSR